MWQINAFHAAFVAPMLAYISYQSINGTPVNYQFGIFLAVLAGFLFLYHIYLMYKKLSATSD